MERIRVEDEEEEEEEGPAGDERPTNRLRVVLRGAVGVLELSILSCESDWFKVKREGKSQSDA